MKCQFGFRKVRYKGLEKNANWVSIALRVDQFTDGEEPITGNSLGEVRPEHAVER